MQKIVFDEPYEFIPPLETNLWPSLIHLYLNRYLRKQYGIQAVECRGAERLRASLEAGHGILLAPNHCRLSDPLVLGVLARQVKTHLFAMASWHLFKQDWLTTFMIRRMGAFSVYREGLDRQAINSAIDILATARRPLILFPEGAISRHNDELMALMDGTAFIARTAARRRAKANPNDKVVVHPIAIRYFFRGDLPAAVEPVLTEIEHRLSWQPQTEVPLVQRVGRVAEALLSLKEVEYLGRAKQGDRYQRVKTLINHILVPLEEAWQINEPDDSVVARVKRIRTAVLPDLIDGQLTQEERDRRWRQLADCYLAQQMSHYPEDYVRADEQIPEHILETVERFEEDLTDEISVCGPFDVVIQVGEAIEVNPGRDRTSEADPVMQGIEHQLTTMLAALAAEAVHADAWHSGQQPV